jgi:hypothetical protein
MRAQGEHKGQASSTPESTLWPYVLDEEGFSEGTKLLTRLNHDSHAPPAQLPLGRVYLCDQRPGSSYKTPARAISNNANRAPQWQGTHTLNFKQSAHKFVLKVCGGQRHDSGAQTRIPGIGLRRDQKRK